MSASSPSGASPQGFGAANAERLPLPAREAMTEAQRAAADAIINGPRKGVYGPFIPLLQTPALTEHVGKLGETLRFHGTLPDGVRELVMCAVARETSNQFEWQTHAALAAKAGVPQTALDALADGRHPHDLRAGEACAVQFAGELMLRNGISDVTYAESVACFGEAGTVELTVLVGYFAMICWVMNVARTPGPAGSAVTGLTAFPR
jgi:4-carboxymuconolactone decarboxylase